MISLYIIVNNYLKIKVLYWILSVGFVCVRLCSVCGYAWGEGVQPTATTGGRSAKGRKGRERAGQIQQQQRPAATPRNQAEQLNRAKSKSQNTHRKRPKKQPPQQKKFVFLRQSLTVKGSSTLNP